MSSKALELQHSTYRRHTYRPVYYARSAVSRMIGVCIIAMSRRIHGLSGSWEKYGRHETFVFHATKNRARSRRGITYTDSHLMELDRRIMRSGWRLISPKSLVKTRGPVLTPRR
jgi:hypothetical protein